MQLIATIDDPAVIHRIIRDHVDDFPWRLGEAGEGIRVGIDSV